MINTKTRREYIVVITLAAIAVLFLLSGCVVHKAKTIKLFRSSEKYEKYLFENRSVADSFLSHLRKRKIQGRYCKEIYILFVGFASEASAPSKLAWMNDYQKKADINGDKLITKDELDFVVSFEDEND